MIIEKKCVETPATAMENIPAKKPAKRNGFWKLIVMREHDSYDHGNIMEARGNLGTLKFSSKSAAGGRQNQIKPNQGGRKTFHCWSVDREEVSP